VWLHVDAAYAGAAAVCPELRWTHEGVEYADSYCFDPHKWLLTGFDCDAFWVADRAALIEALTIMPDYLRNAATESGAVLDYRDWQVPLGRRFRALKLWFVLRWYGVAGLRAHVRSSVELAQRFAAHIAADKRFEIVAPHPFSLVCFRLRAGDGATAAVLARVNAGGRAYLTHTVVRGDYVLRLAVGSPQTGAADLDEAWRLVSAAAAEALRS
jgi:aromatic-L-amino-acid decarboxylase